MKSKALQILDDLAWQDKKQKYPDTPEHILTSKKYKDNTANNLTKAVIDFIKFNKYQAERISVTGRRIDKRKTYTDGIGRTKQIGSIEWVKSSMKKGSADISATIEGYSCKIEIKVGKDRQRDSQKKYQEEIERAGGIYIIVSSFDQFFEWYMNQDFIKNKPKI